MNGLAMPENNFVIFCRGRTGSSLLVQFLNSNEKIHCDGEILRSPVDSPLSVVIDSESHWTRRIYGFKLLSAHLRRLKKDNDIEPLDFMSSLVRRDFKIIYLKRENTLRQALSNLYAKHRKKYHNNRKDAKKPFVKFSVDPDLLIKTIDDSKNLGRYEDWVLKGFPYLRITYEDDLLPSDSHQNTIDKISKYLDIPSMKGRAWAQKITPSKLSDLVENYQEIKLSLKNTPYEKYL